MMIQREVTQKVTARHVSRLAMLYVRQSTLHQVLENTRSVPHGNTPYANGLLLWDGQRNV